MLKRCFDKYINCILGTITYQDLKEGLESDSILLVDVRRRSEVASSGKIPKSFNVPIQEILRGDAFELINSNFKMRYGFEKPKKSVEFIVSGESRKISLKAGKYMKSLGYQRVKIYKGGVKDWIKNGGVIIKGTGKSLLNKVKSFIYL